MLCLIYVHMPFTAQQFCKCVLPIQKVVTNRFNRSSQRTGSLKIKVKRSGKSCSFSFVIQHFITCVVKTQMYLCTLWFIVSRMRNSCRPNSKESLMLFNESFLFYTSDCFLFYSFNIYIFTYLQTALVLRWGFMITWQSAHDQSLASQLVSNRLYRRIQ